jgi:hypothetical protein
MLTQTMWGAFDYVSVGVLEASAFTVNLARRCGEVASVRIPCSDLTTILAELLTIFEVRAALGVDIDVLTYHAMRAQLPNGNHGALIKVQMWRAS